MAVSAGRAPIPPTALIGREGEIARVRELLAESRLVTLTGPGGTGKTRLALAVLTEVESCYRDGLAFVDLAPLSDPGLVASAIASSVGVQEAPGRPLDEALAEFFRRRELVLCLDNFEHLLDGAPLVSRLLSAAAGLRVLATSRALLRLAGEVEYAVPPLPSEEALELFVVRASAAKPSLVLSEEGADAVAEICDHIDRLPLAIELAAARVRTLSPEKLLQRLSEALPLLTQGPRDAPARQQTLRATIEWSYGLLSETEKAVLARLSVFAGGCTLEAAESICEADLDTLASLVAQSLLRGEDVVGETRFSLLETVREYASERLAASSEEEAFKRRHVRYFLAFAEEAAVALDGRKQLEWLDRLDRELDNLRAALRLACSAGEAEVAQRLAGSLWAFWETRRPAEGRNWLEEGLAAAGEVSPAVRGRSLLVLSQVARLQVELGEGRYKLYEAVRIFRELGDRDWLTIALGGLALDAVERREREGFLAVAEEMLALLPEVGSPWAVAFASVALGTWFLLVDDRQQGLALLEEGRRSLEAIGDRMSSSFVLTVIGWEAMLSGDYQRAEELHEEALALGRMLRDPQRIAMSLSNLAVLSAVAHDFARANLLLPESLPLARARRDVPLTAELLIVTSARAASRAEFPEAARLAGAAEVLCQRIGGEWDELQLLLLERDIRPCRESVEDIFDAAWAEGRSMSFDEAIDYALSTLEQLPVELAVPTPVRVSQELEPGAAIAGFVVEGLVGRGGMGVVYRARQQSLDRAVALKVLAPALVEDETYRARFLREAQLAAAIEHPNVLPVYEAGEASGRLFLAVRYVDGEDLGSLLEREGRLECARAVALVGQIAAALDAAHAKDLVHRDVKPSNVLLERHGGMEHALLADFGVAKSTGAKTTALTETGQLVGTVDYLAPELIEGGEAGRRSDVYALGCVLFQLLAGEVPFPRHSPLATAWAHVADDPPPLSLEDVALAARLDGVVQLALAKNSGERFASAGELARAALAALTEGAVLEPRPRVQLEWPEGLPRPATALIGREVELAELGGLMEGRVRLLTLVGPGGLGKTRLALELVRRLAPRFADGVVFVPLAAVADAALVASTVAQAVGLREAGDRAPADLLVDSLCQRRLLLCLDNFEHLLEAAPLVGEIAAAGPEVAVVVTSRAPLRLTAEREYPVPALPESSALELFTERARAINPAFHLDEDMAEAAAAICARLDGLPLAIELAAARTRLLSPRAMASRLDERLELLAGGPRDVPERQRTLRATIDWSYTLLEPEEQRLLARLAVFAGGARLDAIAAVCDAALGAVQSLVENSLLTVRDDPDGEPRYELLETIREYALEMAALSGEAEVTRGRHALFYARFSTRAWDAFLTAKYGANLRRIGLDHDNLRAALEFALDRKDVELALAIGEEMADFWGAYGHIDEGRRLVDAILALADGHGHAGNGALLNAAGHIALAQGRLGDAQVLHQRCAAVYQQAGDDRGVGYALYSLAVDFDAAGEYEGSERLYREAIELLRQTGDEMLVMSAQANLGYSLLVQGRAEEAEKLIAALVESEKTAGMRHWVSVSLNNLAECRLHRSDSRRAGELYREILTGYIDVAQRPGVTIVLDGLALVAALERSDVRAVHLWGFVDESLESMGIGLDTSLGDQRAAARASAREALGDDEFERLLAEGRAMSLDEAIAYAVNGEPS